MIGLQGIFKEFFPEAEFGVGGQADQELGGLRSEGHCETIENQGNVAGGELEQPMWGYAPSSVCPEGPEGQSLGDLHSSDTVYWESGENGLQECGGGMGVYDADAEAFFNDSASQR